MEELLTTRVENWSFSNNLVRLKIPIGVSYGCDVDKAIALCLESAAEVERVSTRTEIGLPAQGFRRQLG